MLSEYQGRTGPARARELSDGDLIERSLAEPGCFAVIFDRHADEILRYAHARLGPGCSRRWMASGSPPR